MKSRHILALVLSGLGVNVHGAAPPVVNGLFFGDGDNADYVLYDESVSGSKLYVFFARPTVYVALVVNQTVNDNVCSPKTAAAYTQSAGWGNHRDCKRASDSEFASFTLRCEVAPLSWAWQQGLARRLANNTWVSDQFGAGTGTPPPGYVSASSFTANVNTYRANWIANGNSPPVPGWDLYQGGTPATTRSDWWSPYTSQATKNTVIGVDGYPSLLNGTYSNTHSWEWPQVYEWSVNLQTAGCGAQPVFFVTGNSHHSPGKSGPENDPFDTPPTDPLSDFGDHPNSYATTLASNGPRHYITITGPYLGSAPDIETDGAPSADATGDQAGLDDEDGVTAATVPSTWMAGQGAAFNIVASGPGLLGAWFDWNNDGDFTDVGEFTTIPVVAGANVLPVTVGLGFNGQTDPLHARFRIFDPAISTTPLFTFTQANYQGVLTNGEVEDHFWEAGTLPVTLAWTQARREGDTVKLEWITASETGATGFLVMAKTASGWRPVGAEIPSKVVNSSAPTHYKASFQGVEADQFVIVDIDRRGKWAMSEPFAIGEARPKPEFESVPWEEIRAHHQDKARERKARRATKAKPAGTDPSAYLDTGTAGIHRVTFEQLRDAGVDFSRTALTRLKLFNDGNEIPIFVSGKGTFGPGEWLEFVAEAADSLYTDTNRYLLTTYKGRGDRIAAVAAAPPKNVGPVTIYRAVARVERDRAYDFSAPGSDPWYDFSLLAWGKPASGSRSIHLDDLVPGGGNALVSVDLWGVTDFPAAPDHHVVVSLNGTRVGEKYLDGSEAAVVSGSVPDGVVVEGNNVVDIRLPFDLPADVQFDLVNVDALAIEYPRHLRARGGRLDFVASGRAIEVTGVEGGGVSLYRVDDHGLTRLEGLREGAGTVTFAGTLDDHQYWLASGDSVLSAAIAPVDPQVDLLADPAEYLIISHPDFLDAIAPLADARRADRSVAVVDVTDVYAVYGDGVVDPRSIKSFVADAVRRLGTSHVLLVGGDSYDYKNHLSLGTTSFVPSIYVPTGPFVSYAPADPLYGDVDADGIPDIPVGRFPVRTDAELHALVAKTLAYGAGYERTAIAASDAADPRLKTSFSDSGTRFIQSLGSDWTAVSADIDGLGTSGARSRLINGLNAGVALTQYFGHSSPSLWSFSGLFSSVDAGKLSNSGRPTVVVQWGCWNTYYVEPAVNTLGHRLMLSGDRGAAAVLGAATLTDVKSDLALGELFSPMLGTPGLTIGETLVAAKRELAETRPDLTDVLVGFTILGDPALVVSPAD